jgi:hypothetical protein
MSLQKPDLKGQIHSLALKYAQIELCARRSEIADIAEIIEPLCLTEVGGGKRASLIGSDQIAIGLIGETLDRGGSDHAGGAGHLKLSLTG